MCFTLSLWQGYFSHILIPSGAAETKACSLYRKESLDKSNRPLARDSSGQNPGPTTVPELNLFLTKQPSRERPAAIEGAIQISAGLNFPSVYRPASVRGMVYSFWGYLSTHEGGKFQQNADIVSEILSLSK